jgi:Ni/Fe-hydrogenase subunit HybB-like protein
MTTHSPAKAATVGYATRTPPKPPPWHGLVVADVLFNNLATGLFMATAVAEATSPEVFGPAAQWAYPLALALLLIDLLCLVLDLGDPLRFHHMLRVFKPTSPMSLGTWCLTAYSLPLTLIVALEVLSPWFSTPAWMHGVTAAVAFPFAIGSAVYKGVLFSTGSQPGWKDARWLGGYLANSAVALGCAELLVLTQFTGPEEATLRLLPALTALLALNLALAGLLAWDLRPALLRKYPARRLVEAAVGMFVFGLVLPVVLLVFGRGAASIDVAVGLIIGSSLAVRAGLVHLPGELGI